MPVSDVWRLFVIAIPQNLLDEGRFKDDNMEGQGTMKMSRNVVVPLTDEKKSMGTDVDAKNDWMIPIEFQSDISHIHQKAGFTQVGL